MRFTAPTETACDVIGQWETAFDNPFTLPGELSGVLR